MVYAVSLEDAPAVAEEATLLHTAATTPPIKIPARHVSNCNNQSVYHTQWVQQVPSNTNSEIKHKQINKLLKTINGLMIQIRQIIIDTLLVQQMPNRTKISC